MSLTKDNAGNPVVVPWIVGTPTNGQAVAYNSATDRYEPTTITSGAQVNSTTTDPTLSSDSSAGYAVGSLWINTSADRAWQCVDASVGAAYWRRIGGPMGALSSDANTVGLYLFDGNLNDSGAGGRNLTSGGTFYYQYGAGSKQSSFWSGGAAASSADTAFKLVSDLSIEVVIHAVMSGSYQTVTVNGNTKRRFYVDLNNSTYPRVNWGYEWSAGTDAVTADFPNDQVVYLAFTRTVSGGNTTLTAYVNGTQASTATNAHTPDDTDAAATLYIGRNNGGGNTLNNPTIYGIHYTTTVLTAAQIKQRAQLVLPIAGFGA